MHVTIEGSEPRVAALREVPGPTASARCAWKRIYFGYPVEECVARYGSVGYRKANHRRHLPTSGCSQRDERAKRREPPAGYLAGRTRNDPRMKGWSRQK